MMKEGSLFTRCHPRGRATSRPLALGPTEGSSIQRCHPDGVLATEGSPRNAHYQGILRFQLRMTGSGFMDVFCLVVV